MEKLFSIKDLSEIEAYANSNLEKYLDKFVIDNDPNEKMISTISIYNQLIFVEGNSDTGFKHLLQRHSIFSLKNFWIINSDGNLKLDNPSKFNPLMMPIIDYVKIADSIFKPENKNITKNNKPELFDKFTGFYCHTNEKPEKYHLIVYKDTKVVHTIFPDKKTNNIKRKVKYARGIITTKLRIPIGHNELTIPYINSNGMIVYSILIRKYYNEKIEKIYIQKHNENGIVKDIHLIKENNLSDFEVFDKLLIERYQYGDLSDLEKFLI